jgi:Inner centromere protein, ARK binding region
MHYILVIFIYLTFERIDPLQSKKTIPKTVAMTATSASSGTKYINSQLKTFSSSKLDPKDRFAEIRAKHQNQQYIEQECQSDIKTVPVNEIKYAFPNPVATIKKTSPTRPALKSTVTTPPLTEEFVCYEMTDGEYDSDDDDASAARASKRIPDWARSANLTKALEVQYSKNFSIDPDELFGEVETCNLEAIFGLTYPKFRRRNSSGDWTKHRVTSEEKRMYKRHIENS